MYVRVLICRSNPISPDPRVEKIARTLASAGYSVQLIGWDNSGKFPEDGDVDGIPIHRFRLPVRRVRGLWNITFELRWQVALFGWLVKHRGDYDLIHACDFDTVLPSLVCKYFWSKHLIYDIFDFYADMLRATPIRLINWIRWVDLRMIDQADAVIIADDSRIQQIAGSHPHLLEIIYNSPEDQMMGIEARQSPVFPKDGLHIAYVGNMQLERGLIYLLKILKNHPEWKLDLAGFGGDEQTILSEASQLRNVTWHGCISYRRALELNNGADVIFSTYDPQIPNHRYSSPNKLFEAMMLGKPVIVARGTNIDQIVEAEKCGMVVEYGNLPELESAFSLLQYDPALRQAYGRNARIAYERVYDWENMKDRLLKLYGKFSQ
jgi:glycosyltransferase involved in cell wall biosynthesis